MPYLANITIIGHLGKDLEIAFTPNKTEVNKFSVAVSTSLGNNRKTTDWFEVVKWGKLQDFIREKLCKGATVCVTGRFNQVTNEYNGKEYKKLQVTASDILVLKESGVDEEETPQRNKRKEPTQEEIPF